MRKLWYVTRKFPPSIGGMQNLSYHIASELAGHEQLELVSWGGSAAGLPWFAVVSTFRLMTGLLRGQVRVLLLGDPSLSWLGSIAKLCGIRVAVVVHGLDITYASGWYQLYLDACFWKRFDAYICISAHVERLVAEHGVPADRRHLIHPGVHVDAAPPGEDRQQEEVRLLLLGRLVRRKGALWFVNDVLPALLQHLPDLKVDIVGDGPDREEIERTISRLGLQHCVSLLGELSEEQKSRHMQQAHALVLPNLPVEADPEGFGLVALEGAAAAKYVFASDLDGLKDAVRAPDAGRLLPPADVQAWTQVLATECADRQRLIEKGAKARQAIIEGDATWASMGRRYRQVLDALG